MSICYRDFEEQSSTAVVQASKTSRKHSVIRLEKIQRRLQPIPVFHSPWSREQKFPCLQEELEFLKPLAGQTLEHSTHRRDWGYGVLAEGQKRRYYIPSLSGSADGVILGKADPPLSITHTTYILVTTDRIRPNQSKKWGSQWQQLYPSIAISLIPVPKPRRLISVRKREYPRT